MYSLSNSFNSCKLDLSSYKPQKQYDLVMNLEDNPGTLHLLLVISGIPAEEGDKSEHLISDALDKFVCVCCISGIKMLCDYLLDISALQKEL